LYLVYPSVNVLLAFKKQLNLKSQLYGDRITAQGGRRRDDDRFNSDCCAGAGPGICSYGSDEWQLR